MPASEFGTGSIEVNDRLCQELDKEYLRNLTATHTQPSYANESAAFAAMVDADIEKMKRETSAPRPTPQTEGYDVGSIQALIDKDLAAAQRDFQAIPALNAGSVGSRLKRY